MAHAVLDEVEGCRECLQALVYFLSSAVARLYSNLTGNDDAIRLTEELIAEVIEQRDLADQLWPATRGDLRWRPE